MAEKVVKPKEQKNTAISMLLFGKAGSGKSVFASTFPKVAVFDFDNGHKLYEKHFKKNGNWYVRGSAALPALQKAILSVIAGDFPYETILIDSLTNLENMAISAKKGFDPSNWADKLYTASGKKLGFDDWGAVSGSTIAILTELRKYPINVVVITQVAEHSSNGHAYYKPQLIGKGADESLHFADFVAYMTKEQGQDGIVRYLHLSSTEEDSFDAKARLLQGDVLPIKNPTYEKLMKLVNSDENNLDFSD